MGTLLACATNLSLWCAARLRAGAESREDSLCPAFRQPRRFCFLPALHRRGVWTGDLHEVAYLARASGAPRVFEDAGYGINLYDDPTT
jgi:hypothetical protein